MRSLAFLFVFQRGSLNYFDDAASFWVCLNAGQSKKKDWISMAK